MRKFYIYIIIFLATSFFVVESVYAKKTLSDADASLVTVSQKTGIDQGDWVTISANVVGTLLIAAGLAFFILMVYAGIRWMTARDKEEVVEKSRNTIISAVIGIVIISSAYALSNFISTSLIKGVSTENNSSTNALSVGCVSKQSSLNSCNNKNVQLKTACNNLPSCQWSINLNVCETKILAVDCDIYDVAIAPTQTQINNCNNTSGCKAVVDSNLKLDCQIKSNIENNCNLVNTNAEDICNEAGNFCIYRNSSCQLIEPCESYGSQDSCVSNSYCEWKN